MCYTRTYLFYKQQIIEWQLVLLIIHVKRKYEKEIKYNLINFTVDTIKVDDKRSKVKNIKL